MPPWNAAKAKVQLRLSVQRLRTLQEKKNAQAKMARREIALLLERGKVETARIKVENIVHEDIHLELLELLELYCELLISRFGLLDQSTSEPDPGVSEGVCSIIYAAPRTELKELQILRDILMHKYGRDFSLAVMENKDGRVSERVVRKLNLATPSPALVDGYLTEIAKAYGVEWSAPVPPAAPSDGGAGADGGIKETPPAYDGAPAPSSASPAPPLSPSISPPSAADALHPRTPKLPDLPPTEDGGHAGSNDGKGGGVAGGAAGGGGKGKKAPPEDEFDALAKRFEALKKR